MTADRGGGSGVELQSLLAQGTGYERLPTPPKGDSANGHSNGKPNDLVRASTAEDAEDSTQPLLARGANGEGLPSSSRACDSGTGLAGSSQKAGSSGHATAPRFNFLGFCSFFGSGLLMSVAYLDPGNLEASIQVGVQAGYTLLWWYAFCSIILGFAFQQLAGKLGLVTGRDLAQHCGERYPKVACWIMWFLLEVAIVGADIQETIGSALAISILSGGRLPLWIGCIIISLTAFALLLLENTGFRQLEAVFGVFIAVEAVAMGINFFQADIPPKDLVLGLVVPKLSASTLSVAVGALGALVMPYNVFFQSSVVNKRPRDTDTDDKKRLLCSYMAVENLFVLVMAFIINIFVVCVFAKGFFQPFEKVASGEAEVQELGLETAGDHLAERYGTAFKYIWAVGLLASGQVSTIGLTYAGQLVMTGLLNLKVGAGARMVATRTVALLPTVILAVAFEASNTFDVVAQALNIVQSVVLPFALIPVVYMTSRTDVMGEKFVNPRWVVWTTGSIAVLVLAVNGYLISDFLRNTVHSVSPAAAFGFSIFFIAYYVVSLYFGVGPENWPWLLRKARGWLLQTCKFLRNSERWQDRESMLEVHW